MHRLTVEAGKRIATAGLSRREIARRLGTSAPQLYRLLDPANSSKSINQLVSLLHVLGCEVESRGEAPVGRMNKVFQPRRGNTQVPGPCAHGSIHRTDTIVPCDLPIQYCWMSPPACA